MPVVEKATIVALKAWGSYDDLAVQSAVDEIFARCDWVPSKDSAT